MPTVKPTGLSVKLYGTAVIQWIQIAVKIAAQHAGAGFLAALMIVHAKKQVTGTNRSPAKILLRLTKLFYR